MSKLPLEVVVLIMSEREQIINVLLKTYNIKNAQEIKTQKK